MNVFRKAEQVRDNNMKILILTQGIKNNVVLDQGLAMAKTYASTIGLDFEYTFKPTNKKFTTIVDTEIITDPLRVWVKPEEILEEGSEGYKVVCLLHGSILVPPASNPWHHGIEKKGCTPIQIPENWWVTFPQTLCDYFLHEISHAGHYFGKKIDETHNQQKYPEWQNKQPYEYYLFLLKQVKQYLDTTPIIIEPTLYYRSPLKESVKQMQTLLGGLAVDGSFGPKTLEKLKSFQKARGLVSDGVCGPKTWAELKKKSKPKLSLIEAIIEVESNGNDMAIGDLNLRYKAYGPMQIRQPVCIDVNNRFGTNYKSTDCLGNRPLSIEIWNKYQSIYNEGGTDEQKSRTWNGGPGWQRNPSFTDGYWAKVQKLLNN